MISNFSADLQSLVRGVEGSERLLQECRPAHQQLKFDILSTAPNFRPFKNAKDDKEGFKFEIDGDDTSGSESGDTGVKRPIYLEDVKSNIQRYVPS